MKPVQADSSPDWSTPPEIIEAYTEEFGPLHDPCPLHSETDTLEVPYPMDRATFVNPPYTRGQIGLWVRKCFSEWYATGSTVILLIPPYTDTAYFHENILPWCEIRFIRGRLKFGGSSTAAPFPSMICIWPGSQPSEFFGSIRRPEEKGELS